MNTSAIAKHAFFSILDYPLEVLSSKESSKLMKVISTIAIAILSLTVVYAVYAYRFFADRKVISLKEEFNNAVEAKNHAEATRLLNKYPFLKQHLDVNGFPGGESSSLFAPILIAAELNDLKMVKLLRENGASLEILGRTGHTALEMAASSGFLDMVKYLVESGAKIEGGGGGETPLVLAAQKADLNFEVIKYLVEHGANVNPDWGIASVLALIASNYTKKPAECLTLVGLLVNKGAEFRPSDDKFEIHADVKDFVNKHKNNSSSASADITQPAASGTHKPSD